MHRWRARPASGSGGASERRASLWRLRAICRGRTSTCFVARKISGATGHSAILANGRRWAIRVLHRSALSLRWIKHRRSCERPFPSRPGGHRRSQLRRRRAKWPGPKHASMEFEDFESTADGEVFTDVELMALADELLQVESGVRRHQAVLPHVWRGGQGTAGEEFYPFIGDAIRRAGPVIRAPAGRRRHPEEGCKAVAAGHRSGARRERCWPAQLTLSCPPRPRPPLTSWAL